MNWIYFNNVSSNPELTPVKLDVVSLILHEYQTGKNFRPVVNVADSYSKGEFSIVFRRTYTVNAAYTAYNDYIIP